MSGKVVIFLHCLSLFVSLFTRFCNNLCRRTCGPVIQGVPFFFEGGGVGGGGIS